MTVNFEFQSFKIYNSKFKIIYASIFAYTAFFSINSLRGGTSSPINIEKTLSASAKLSIFIQRYKGLGEMNAEQLWDTTLNPEFRTLRQINILV